MRFRFSTTNAIEFLTSLANALFNVFLFSSVMSFLLFASCLYFSLNYSFYIDSSVYFLSNLCEIHSSNYIYSWLLNK